MLDMATELKLPEIVLAEQLLNNCGITEDHKLLIRTALQGDITFDRVAQELINQHPHIHDKHNSQVQRRPFQEGRPGVKPYLWNTQRSTYKTTFKGGKYGSFGKKGSRPLAFHAEGEYAEEYDDGEYDYFEDNDAHVACGYMSQYADETAGYLDPYETGTYAEEHLAFLVDSGLDLEDEDACAKASEITHAENEAYYNRKGATAKGYPGMKAPPFEISGSFTLDEKRARLQSLKARTTCRKCGAVGHWSGDAICPLTKGKGKMTAPRAGASSTSISPGAGRGAVPKENHFKRAAAKSKPCAVYLSLREHQGPSHPTANLAYRTPASPHRQPQDYRRVPPPRSLDEAAASGSTALSPTTTSSWLQCVEDDADMAMLIDSLGNGETHEINPMPLQDGPLALPAPQRHGPTEVTPAPAAERSTAAASSSSLCSHRQTTTKGSNQFYMIRKCKDCGHVLERKQRTAKDNAANMTQVKGCPHHRITWKGSNGFVRVKTCQDCGFQEKFTAKHVYKPPPLNSSSSSMASRVAGGGNATSTDLTAKEALHVVTPSRRPCTSRSPN